MILIHLELRSVAGLQSQPVCCYKLTTRLARDICDSFSCLKLECRGHSVLKIQGLPWRQSSGTACVRLPRGTLSTSAAPSSGPTSTSAPASPRGPCSLTATPLRFLKCSKGRETFRILKDLCHTGKAGRPVEIYWQNSKLCHNHWSVV